MPLLFQPINKRPSQIEVNFYDCSLASLIDESGIVIEKVDQTPIKEKKANCAISSLKFHIANFSG